jgi:hypothetical protein
MEMLLTRALGALLIAVSLQGINSSYAQKQNTGVEIVDSVLAKRKRNRILTQESFEKIPFDKQSISGVFFFSDKKNLIAKFGSGRAFVKRFTDNSVDVDEPSFYSRQYLKYQNSLFEIDDNNRICGFILKDSTFVLDFFKIRVGERLRDLAKKLPHSFQELQVTTDSFQLIIKFVDFDCGDCYANIVLIIDRKSQKLLSIEQQINY